MPRPKKQINDLVLGTPEKPANLSQAASRNWDRLICEMEDSGIALIPGFRPAIAQAATIQADLEVAWADVHKNGRYIVSKTGVKKINPAVEDTHKLNEKLMRALYQLGLTPKSIGGNAGKENDDGPTLDQILNG